LLVLLLNSHTHRPDFELSLSECTNDTLSSPVKFDQLDVLPILLDLPNEPKTPNNFAEFFGFPSTRTELKEDDEIVYDQTPDHPPPAVTNQPPLQQIRIENLEWGTKLTSRIIPNHFLSIPPSRAKNSIVSYLCFTPDVPGKFDPKRAAALGIRPGPLFSELVKGNNITLNGQTITPSQCMDPTQPGPAFLVLACPMQSLVETLATKVLRAIEPHQNRIAFAVHLVPAQIVEHESYQLFLKKFPPKTQVRTLEQKKKNSSFFPHLFVFCFFFLHFCAACFHQRVVQRQLCIFLGFRTTSKTERNPSIHFLSATSLSK
jgi:hypothetical protein